MAEHTEPNLDLTSFVGRLNGSKGVLLVDPRPGVEGRWQPTRAGVVNSWLWSDEQFLFQDGWLALVGENGSGKSLTGTTWCPTLIDGDVSRRGLSVGERAAGTLSDRHVNWESGPPKTGLWWKELGRTDVDSSTQERTTRWLTVGLWLRNRGSDRKVVERAWFLAPARVGENLALVRDGTPVDLEDLAQQLAEHEGRLFTSNERLVRVASKHLAVVTGEDEFEEAVRGTLYQPLDPDQLNALTTVLRALRRVSVNDKINPDDMRASLTSALPALDGARVQRLADALTKAEQLDRRLQHARKQQETLAHVAAAYSRYAGAVAALISARLLQNNDQCERIAREEKDLHRQQADQERIKQEAETTTQELTRRIENLNQTIESLRSNLSEHPGAGLDHLERTADHLETIAEHAEEQATEAEHTARATSEAAGEHYSLATAAAAHLRSLLDQIHRDADELHAAAFHHQLATVSGPLVEEEPTVPPADLDDRVAEAKHAFHEWADERARAVEAINLAISDLRSARDAREATQGRLTEAQNTADDAETEATQAAEQCRTAEQDLLDQLSTIVAGFRHLPAPPVKLLTSQPLGIDAIEHWARDALDHTLQALDVPGAESRAAVATDAATYARTEADQARTNAADTARSAGSAAEPLAGLAAQLPEAPPSLADLIAVARKVAEHAIDYDPDQLNAVIEDISNAETNARTQLFERRRALQHAARLLEEWERVQAQANRDQARAEEAERKAAQAERAATTADHKATTAADTWAHDVRTWIDDLQVVDSTQLPLSILDDPCQADPNSLIVGVATAHRQAAITLTAARTAAETEAAELAAQCRRLDAKVTEVEQGDPAPESPSWRADRTNRPGAPLWALVDFAEGLPPDQAGKLEGALLTAGLLDAWVSSDGQLTDGDLHLVPGEPLSGPTLANLLVPDPRSAIPAPQVHALLASIRVADSVDDWEAPVVFELGGTMRSGLLKASRPEGWTPRHIGPTARERTRQQQLAQLSAQRDQVEAARTEAANRAQQTQDALDRAQQEAASLPDSTLLLQHRHEATERRVTAHRLREEVRAAQTLAEHTTASAHEAHSLARDAYADAFLPPESDAVHSAIGICTDLPDLVAQAASTSRAATAAAHHACDNAQRANELEQRRNAAVAAAADAQQAATEARAEYHELPDLAVVRQTRERAQEATHTAENAADAVASLATQAQRDEAAVRGALERLNKTVRTPDGRMLPTDSAELSHYRHQVSALRDCVADWAHAATRTHLLIDTAAHHRRAADEAQHRAQQARSWATRTRDDAQTARHRYTEELRQHGRSYQALVDELGQRRREGTEVSTDLDAQRATAHRADIEATRITTQLAGVQQRRDQAVRTRADSLTALQEVFDHHLAVEITGAETLRRPPHLESGLDTAHRIIQLRNLHDVDWDECVPRAQSAADHVLRELDTRVRNVRDRLFQFGRHIELEDVPQAAWKRVTLTEQSQAAADLAPSDTSTQSLRTVLEDLNRSIQTLQTDFNEQVHTEIKGTVFTDLRKHINLKIALAEQIVEDIQTTLSTVRTGVARVGIKLAWKPREDPAAHEAISLIRKPDLEGAFDRMYDFFIRKLDEGSQEPSWTARVQEVFDYRNWYEWEIRLTHAEFAGPHDAGEVFRTVTPRHNPLDALSAGEKRLATMLPMLAAIRAFYSIEGYQGPHMIFIDELDATFDPPNLRKVIALLRAWDFDVLATLPSMRPLLVAETGSAGLHKISKRGDGLRYSIPCIWRGAGTPVTARIAVGGGHHSHHSGSSTPPPDAPPPHPFDGPAGEI
ncbi:SbcC/MukB-like Walker B domain-containing protein [Saccharopolyspora spinosa]|uniref:Exonuclease SbcCD C subunit n=1 Tax=Saccharopolyspora spinosa TaxID=60894 RepID=A0A2N3Y6Z5_SACSN|nr:SbcC/MukB-like Walker B domain-containing protein [Saccharopolyspora spinosa]PKW18704.1 putative exonuclease SbcCD C subunit [Saccharopolyspora spinosa]